MTRRVCGQRARNSGARRVARLRRRARARHRRRRSSVLAARDGPAHRALRVSRRQAHGDGLRPSAVSRGRDLFPVPPQGRRALRHAVRASGTARRCCSACSPAGTSTRISSTPSSACPSSTRRSRISVDSAVSASSRTRRRPCCSSGSSTASVSRRSCRTWRCRGRARHEHGLVQRRRRDRPAARARLMLIAFNLWRRSGAFFRHAFAGNVALMAAGFVLAGFQLTGFSSLSRRALSANGDGVRAPSSSILNAPR